MALLIGRGGRAVGDLRVQPFRSAFIDRSARDSLSRCASPSPLLRQQRQCRSRRNRQFDSAKVAAIGGENRLRAMAFRLSRYHRITFSQSALFGFIGLLLRLLVGFLLCKFARLTSKIMLLCTKLQAGVLIDALAGCVRSARPSYVERSSSRIFLISTLAFLLSLRRSIRRRTDSPWRTSDLRSPSGYAEALT